MISDERLLTVEDLTVCRGGVTLVSDLSFQVCQGKALWVRGRNGAGKTSLLRTVCGLQPPERGRVSWAPHTRTAAASRAPCLYLGHRLGLHGDLTVLEGLRFLDQLQGGVHVDEAYLLALDVLGLRARHHLPIRLLSEGQRKRVALARLALSAGTGVWVLDEPMDALDVEVLRVVHGLLEDHLQTGGGILLTSHIPLTLNPGRLEQLCLDGEEAP